MRSIILLLLFVFTAVYATAQHTEYLTIKFEPEYKLKKVNSSVNDTGIGTAYIPEAETSDSPSLVLSVNMYDEHHKDLNAVFEKFKQGFEKGSRIATLEREDGGKNPYMILRVVKPASETEPAKSDLYYITQGQLNLFIVYVEVKKEAFTPQFVAKWKTIFKRSPVVHEEN